MDKLFKPNTAVGRNQLYVIRFKDLDDEIQIALQNSDKWEGWKDKNLELLKLIEELEQKNRDLKTFIESSRVATVDHAKANKAYEKTLEMIANEIDSLAWARKEANRVLIEHSPEYEMEEDKCSCD